MNCRIREMRESTGLTQKAFAELFSIPLSTLQKWEQGAAEPAPYILKMITKLLPEKYSDKECIQASERYRFYYDALRNTVTDQCGTRIPLSCSIENINRRNLGIYFERLFDSYYEMQKEFQKDCDLDHRLPYTLTVMT